MKLQKKLILIRDAAISIEAAHSQDEIIEWVRLGHPFDLLFFAELTDARWLPVLVSSGFYSTLPEMETKSDGTLTYPRSAALSGLAKLASKAPHDILEILEPLEIPENPAIKDQLMGILSEIKDASEIDRVIKIAKKVVRTKPYTSLVWIDNVLANALKNENHAAALELTEALLDVTILATEIDARSVDAWQIGEIDRNILEVISETEPLQAATITFRAFLKWIDIQRVRERGAPKSSVDALFTSKASVNDKDTPSSYWLEDFHGSVIGTHDLEAILAYRLFNIGSQILKNNDLDNFEKFDEMLRGNPWNLFERLRWQLYADFPAFTCQQARRDVVSRICSLGLYSGSHGFEMAQMLESQCSLHGSSLLDSDEVTTFARNVRNGPIDREGKKEDDPQFIKTFHRKQLYPIRSLLVGEDFSYFTGLFEGVPKVQAESFKPFSSGGVRMVENIPPKKASEMPSMSDAELWEFLNNWVADPKRPDPNKWWVEEDAKALGIKFSELMESTPERFQAADKWWENLKRPSVLFKPLEQATARIEKASKGDSDQNVEPEENDWRNWFGLADWITHRRGESSLSNDLGEKGIELEERDWNWPCMIVVRFLNTALTSNLELPADLIAEIGRLIRKLIEDRDGRLEDKDKPWMDDWQSTAINSVRGTALEGLLELSMFNKRKGGDPDPEGWIYDLIESRLISPDESPAVFAILGARLRLLLYLFHDQFKTKPELLLPPDNLDRRNTFLLSHVRYDNPTGQVIETLPSLPESAIDCLAEKIRLGGTDDENRGNYGGRLGSHLGFYYWNDLFPDQETADAILDKYFATANPAQRRSFIGNVARIFEKAPESEEMKNLSALVCRMWDRRFQKIECNLASNIFEHAEIVGELSAFIGWIECECFPFDWRHQRVLAAIGHLSKVSRSGFTIKKLEEISSKEERLHAAVEILNALISKESEELRWSYQEKMVRPILRRGLASTEEKTRQLAVQVQERLLERGLFEYLDIQTAQES